MQNYLQLAYQLATRKCMIKVFGEGGRGTDTFKPPPLCEQLLPLPTPCFKMFLERSLNDTQHPTSSILHCYPLPIHHPFPPPKNFDHTPTRICSKLKLGVCGVLLDYEHIRYAGPPLWNLLFILYQECFCQFSVPKNIKKGLSCLCLRVRARKQITKIATVA